MIERDINAKCRIPAKRDPADHRFARVERSGLEVKTEFFGLLDRLQSFGKVRFGRDRPKSFGRKLKRAPARERVLPNGSAREVASDRGLRLLGRRLGVLGLSRSELLKAMREH